VLIFEEVERVVSGLGGGSEGADAWESISGSEKVGNHQCTHIGKLMMHSCLWPSTPRIYNCRSQTGGSTRGMRIVPGTALR
jgi:hypothetical protein